MEKLKPMHPGEVIKLLYLEPLAISAGELARRLMVPRTRIERIVKTQTSITPDTALRLARHFDTTPEYWMNMQNGFDLRRAEEQSSGTLSRIEVLESA